MQKDLVSKFHDIVIKLNGWDEPNSGRILHIADIFVNGLLENEKYFGDWNRLDEKLDKVTIDSPDGKFVYIPAESGGFLINTTNYEKIKLPYKRISTVKFLGNYFWNSILIIVYTDEITLFNTVNSISSVTNFPANNVVWSEISATNDILVTYRDSVTKINKTSKLDLHNLEFK